MIDIENLSKTENYQVPEGYFEQLPGQIMNTIRKERARRRNIIFSSVAAVALLVICSTLVINYKTNEAKEQQKQIAIEAGLKSSQLEEQMVDYYSDELAQMDYYNY